MTILSENEITKARDELWNQLHDDEITALPIEWRNLCSIVFSCSPASSPYIGNIATDLSIEKRFCICIMLLMELLKYQRMTVQSSVQEEKKFSVCFEQIARKVYA